MKLPSVLCALIVALAALATSADGAFAASNTEPSPRPTPPTKEFQSTTVNTSRSNIKNNLRKLCVDANGNETPCLGNPNNPTTGPATQMPQSAPN